MRDASMEGAQGCFPHTVTMTGMTGKKDFCNNVKTSA